jgi:hypothetical protein
MNKGGLIVAGVFSTIAGVATLVSAVFSVLSGMIAYSVMGFIGGLLWISCAVCVFVFACSARYQAARDPDDEDDNDIERGASSTIKSNETVENMAAIASLQKVSPSGAAVRMDEVSALGWSADSDGRSIKKTVTYLPDGRIKTETEVTLPDDTKQVTTAIEQPKE